MNWRKPNEYIITAIRKKYLVKEWLVLIALVISFLATLIFGVIVYRKGKLEVGGVIFIVIVSIILLVLICGKIVLINKILRAKMQYSVATYNRRYRKKKQYIDVVITDENKPLEFMFNCNVTYLERGDKVYIVRINGEMYIVEAEGFDEIRKMRKLMNKTERNNTINVMLKCVMSLSILQGILFSVISFDRLIYGIIGCAVVSIVCLLVLLIHK